MTMVIAAFAEALKNGLGFDAEPTSSETTGLADAIITEFGIATVSNAPGTVNGVAPSSGGPLISGLASGGTILGMTGASLAGNMKTKMNKPSITAELQGMADAMVNHFLTGTVAFASGLIVGVCSNTLVSPGPLVGSGSGGLISGYDGTVLANLMATSMGKPGTTPELISFCNNMVTYIMSNASVTYGPATISGTCSAGGGPIAAGTGAGGTIA